MDHMGSLLNFQYNGQYHPLQQQQQQQQQHHHHPTVVSSVQHHHHHHHQQVGPPQAPPAPPPPPPPPQRQTWDTQLGGEMWLTSYRGLDLIHSLAGDWVVSDQFPRDSTFQGLKVHADGSFYCTGGSVKGGEITVVNPTVREVRLTDSEKIENSFIFSVTPDGRHMAGRHLATNAKWHLEKKSRRANLTSTLSSTSKSLGSDRSSTSEITQQRLKELIKEAWRAGRASAGSVSSDSSAAKTTAFQHNTFKAHEDTDTDESTHCPVFGQVLCRRKGTDQQQRELSKGIAVCKLASGILNKLLVAKQAGIDPNSVCLSTAAHRVARLNGEQEHPRNQIFEIVVRDITRHGLSGWDAQALSKVLWACATAGFKSPELFGASEDFVHHQGLASFRSQHLAYLVWSFSTTGHKTSLLYEKVDGEIVKRGLSTFNSQDICMCLRGFSSAGHKGVCFYRVAEAEIAKRGLSPFNPQEVASVLASFVSVGQRFQLLLQTVNTHTGLSGYSGAVLAGVVKSVSALLAHETTVSRHVVCGEFFDSVSVEITRRLSTEPATLSPPHLTIVAWSYVRAGLSSSKLLHLIAFHLTQRGLDSLTGQDLTHLAWAYSPGCPKVLHMVAKEVTSRGGLQLNSSEFTTILTSLSVDDRQAAEACIALSKVLSAKRLRYFRDAELVSCLKSLCSMGVANEAFIKKSGLEIGKRGFKGADASSCVTAAWVFARWGVHGIVDMVGCEMEKRPTRLFSPTDLTLLISAFAKEKLFSRVAACYQEILKRPSSAFTPLQLTDIIHALHEAALDPSVLLRLIEGDVLSRGFTTYGRHATNVILLFLASFPPPLYHDWPAIRAWIPLPPQTIPNADILTAIEALGYTPVVKAVVGRVMYCITVPDLKVVIEDTSTPLPDCSVSNSTIPIMSKALGHEGWSVIPIDWAAFKGNTQAGISAIISLLQEAKKHVPMLVQVSDESGEEGEEAEGYEEGEGSSSEAMAPL